MAVPFIPTQVTPTFAPTFSPPTTCFPNTIASTYTLAPQGLDGLTSNRIVIRAFETQCYPPEITDFGKSTTITVTSASETVTYTTMTANYFTGTACPMGFMSAGQENQGTEPVAQCCPIGDFTLRPVPLVVFESGCFQIPSKPVKLLNVTISSLQTPTNAPYGISYRPIPVVLAGNGTISSTTPTPASTTTSAGSGLSTGAKVGIGVGVGVGVVVLFLLGGCLFWLQKRRRQRSRVGDASVQNNKLVEVAADGRNVHELDQTEVLEADDPRNRKVKHELEGDLGSRVEVPVNEKPVELPAEREG